MAPHFLISNCPRPFHLVAGWVHMLERHGNRLIFEFTLNPVNAGMELLGHDKRFKVPFEVMLMGATAKYGHAMEEPRNVRFLGRFLIPGELQGGNGRFTYIDSVKAAPALNMWQWEVVFNPEAHAHTDIGFVTMLDRPLPEEWNL